METWSKDIVARFLPLYEDRACLWDQDDANYHDRAQRVSAMETLVDDLGIEIDVDELRKKIKSIRTMYIRELGRVQYSQRADQSELYVSKVPWFYQADTFLRRSVTARSANSSMIVTCNDDMDDSETQLEESPAAIWMKKPKLTKKKSVKHDLKKIASNGYGKKPKVAMQSPSGDSIENSQTPLIGFIGAGKMALSLAMGLIDSGFVRADSVLVSAPSNKNLGSWKNLGTKTTHDNAEVIDGCNIIMIAVKPNVFDTVINNLPRGKFGHKVFISIMLGVPLRHLKSKLSGICTASPTVIRAMPNTPSVVGVGCTGISVDDNDVSEVHRAFVEKLFMSVGIVVELPESQQDAFAALSGAGPAFVYTMLEALADGAVQMGLPRSLAVYASAQVFKGASEMSMVTGEHTGKLRDNVCSPGGATIQGIHALEVGGVRAAIMNAVHASTEASKTLGQKY